MAVEASLSVNVTSGQVPLAVEFTLDASPSGDEVSWELDLGNDIVENGAELPASVTYTYDVPENYTVLLTITVDGRSAQANLTITAQEIPIPPPNPLQEGENGDCLDALLFSSIPGTPLQSPVDPVKVTVGPDTRWEGTVSEGRITVSFYRENDTFIEGQSGGGTVPDDADYGLICVRQDSPNPLPSLSATWTYQDGLQPEEGEE